MNEHPGLSPMDLAENDPSADWEKAEWDTILGLEAAVAATEKDVTDKYTPVLREHLAKKRFELITTINQSIQKTEAKITEMKNSGANASSLEWHLNNLYGKLADAEGKTDQLKAA